MRSQNSNNNHYYNYYGETPKPTSNSANSTAYSDASNFSGGHYNPSNAYNQHYGAPQSENNPHNPNNANSASSNNKASQDFEHLCRVIGDSVSQATKAIGEGLQNSKDPIVENLSNAGNAISNAIGKSYETYKQKQAEAQVREELRRQQAIVEARYASPGKLKTGAIVQASVCGLLSIAFGDALIGELLAFGTASTVSWVAGVAVTGVLTFFSIKHLIKGINKIHLANMLSKYKQIIGNREVISIAELASRTNTNPRKTLGNIEDIISDGLLPEGRIDDERTTLMVTNGAYNEYLRYRKEQALRQHEELMAKQRAEAEAKALGLTPEMREFFNNGEDYLVQMRQLDEAIQDEVVSAKIVAIEGTIQRILARAKEEPSVINGLGKLMNYYLPTTVKLLTAYDALEEETIQGENITSSRQEIEQTLDVLYAAYEKLLDATFEDLSMDVSSDITVLHTVLAQEGLIDGPFDNRERNQDV